ncbi:mRNA decay activator protein ZFP36L1 [Halotydeus destructor]|nr:mRNA decay activator protein ZFP36L1 [Halotydeus destructor]
MSTALVSTFYEYGGDRYRVNAASSTPGSNLSGSVNIVGHNSTTNSNHYHQRTVFRSNNHQQQQQHQLNQHSHHILERKNTFPFLDSTSSHVNIQGHSARPITNHSNLSGNVLTMTQRSILSSGQTNDGHGHHHHQQQQHHHHHQTLCQTMSVNVIGNSQLSKQQSIEHKKLDRSMSEPATDKMRMSQQLQQQQTACASSRYKTEMCRPFEENGVCKYGEKCQFAHGYHELRNLHRHPKYKTELCRTFHTTGFCPYGPRCHFIHNNSDESKKSAMDTLQTGFGSPVAQQQQQDNKLSYHRQQMHSNNMNEALFNGINTVIRKNGIPCPPPLRTKALSFGSFSMGSSSGGDLSPPSSPTSLNSLFSEEAFIGFTSSFGQSRIGQGFASIMEANHNQRNNLGSVGTKKQSQPSESAVPTLQSVLDLVSSSSDSDNCDQSESGKSCSSSGIGSASPPPASYFSYPAAPSSPVDSLGSELDMLSLGDSSPVPNNSSPSPSDGGLLPPRLPIFTRFANNSGNNSD